MLACATAASETVCAQETGALSGVVTESGTERPLADVLVNVTGTGLGTATSPSGHFSLSNIPPGLQVVLFRRLGYAADSQQVTVVPGDTVRLSATLERRPINLGELTVLAASRHPERMVDAPAAVSEVAASTLRSVSASGQLPQALVGLPGVDLTQSGMNDFNLNSRGFNTTLNRRVLVLQDGRDLAVPFLGAQEWGSLAMSLQDLGRVELVRGPGSALYGANAFSGVLSITTPLARDTRGARLNVAGGELSSFSGDFRYAGLASGDRVGYRVEAGYRQSDTWSRSRTSFDGLDLQREYAGTTDEPVGQVTELLPLAGQTRDPATGTAMGDRTPLRSYYGSARVDYYSRNGSVGTVEGGGALTENELYVTGAGRTQIPQAIRPWARLAWAAERFQVMAYYNGRENLKTALELGSGAPFENVSALFHLEGQYNRPFQAERGHWVVGGSVRQVHEDSKGTVLEPSDDHRTDSFQSVYGQVEYGFTPWLRAVAALRYDHATMYPSQFSPKGALVFTPARGHSIRVTVNRAFQSPVYVELFGSVPAGPPADLSALEAGLRASPLGPALAGVPDGELFTNSAAVPVLLKGNSDLNVEHVLAWEAGYKGELGSRAYLTVDAYWNHLQDFVVLEPGGNPAYPPWTAPSAVPDPAKAPLEQAVHDQLGAAGQDVAAAGLTNLPDGSTAIVVSYTNAGKVSEAGVEIGAGYQLTPALRADASLGYFDFKVVETAPTAPLNPNTPGWKGTVSLSYADQRGWDWGIGVRLTDGFMWTAGVDRGYVPAAETVNASVGYRITPRWRIYAMGTNVLDQHRFQMYDGSVIGRRVLAGLTAYF